LLHAEGDGFVNPVTELRVHLGAHKTATTHLQDSLVAHRDAIVRAGIDYIPREDFGPLQRRFSNPDHWRKRLWSWPVEQLFLRQFKELRSGAPTVLLSDEDLLGFSYDLFTPPVYRDLRGLHVVRSLARNTELILFLSIRSFDQILPSAYAQTIKAIAPKSGWLDEIRAGIKHAPPSWVELVGRLTAMFPQATLRVWQQEDYRAHSQEILSFFVGRDVGCFPDLPPPVRTTSPSNEAIEAAERVDPSLSMEARRKRVRELFYEDLPAGDGRAPFKPLDDDEITLLRERYKADKREIEQLYPGMLFRPSGAP